MAEITYEQTSMAARKPPAPPVNLLIYPVMLFLGAFFILPITWFFVKSAVDYNGNFLLMLLSTFTSPLFIAVAWKTVWISLVVTVLTLLLAYPVAYTLARSSSFHFTIIIICVVLPYFTSIIVRTYSWMIILGTRGVINRFLLWTGVVDRPIALIYNMTGVVIGMTYVLLPYFILTLYSNMKGIDLWLVKAARGMGASNLYAFRKIYLPLSMPGIISGFLIVYILAAGFFITPTLMGGPKDVMMATLIQRNVEVTLNWPLASALSLFLLFITLIIYAIYCKCTDIGKMLGE